MYTGLKMSTGQRQPQSVATWADTFPEHQVSQLQSTAFMKKLLAIAVSNIAYMRVLFPEDAFCDRNLEGLNLKILKNNKSCPPAVQMVDWLKGVFDALDKKYLRTLVLGMCRHSSDPNTLVEMYTFRFSYSDKTEMEIYNGDRKISSASTASQTKKATIALLHDLIVLIQSLSVLPEGVRVTMKLFYYENVTPKNYEPPGFKPSESDFIRMEGNPSKFRFQTVSTKFHSLKVRFVADASMTSDDEVVSVLSGQPMTEEVMTEMDVEMADSQTQQDSVASNGRPERCSQASIAADDGNSPPAEEMCSDVEDDKPQGVLCPCMVNEDDGLMILCSCCHYWQHAVCFKILDGSIAPANHVCNVCCESADDATDPELTGVNESEAQMICLWRRSLAACLEVGLYHLNNAQLACRLGVTNDLAKRLMERLVAEGYATKKGKFASATKFIQKKKIKHDALVKYFSRNNTTAMDSEC